MTDDIKEDKQKFNTTLTMGVFTCMIDCYGLLLSDFLTITIFIVVLLWI